MACNCLTYECLDVVQQFEGCPSVVTLDLLATETGTVQWLFEFNGRWKGGTVDIVEGDNIVLPWVFNENYVHLIKFYNVAGVKSDVCYKLDTSKIAGDYTTPSGTSSNMGYLELEITSGMLSNGGITVTTVSISNRNIILISDGNQIYNISSFTQSGNSFTMTNGTSFAEGQYLTLIFG